MRTELHEGTTMLQSPIATLTTLALPFLLTGCLVNPVQPSIDPTPYETPEYRAQKALAIVNASALYARGGTGQDVAVAVVDSGLNDNLPEFQGRLRDPGFDYVENRSAPSTELVTAPKWPAFWRPTRTTKACTVLPSALS